SSDHACYTPALHDALPIWSRDATEVADSNELFGIWVVEYISERPVIDGSPARIQFGADGAINGNASCNRFFGDYTYQEGRLTIKDRKSTRLNSSHVKISYA